MTGIGQTIHDLRHKATLTLEELGQRSGVSASEISKVERGKRNPSLRTMIYLVRGLEIPVETLSDKLQVTYFKAKHSREVERFSKLEPRMQRLLLNDILPLVERIKGEKVSNHSSGRFRGAMGKFYG